MSPQEALDFHHGRLYRFLRIVSRRLRLLAGLEFLLLLACALILVFLGGLFVWEFQDRLPYLSFCYALAGILFLFACLFLGLWRILHGPPLSRIARGLEEQFPALKDDVTNSLLLFAQAQRGTELTSAALIGAQLRKTADRLEAIPPEQAVSFKKALRHLRFLVPLAAALFGVLAIDPLFLNRSLALFLHPFSALPVRETRISVEPRGAIALRGTAVTITAQASGTIPAKLELEIRPEARQAQRLAMDPEGDGRFKVLIAQVQSSFRYQAQSGRAASPSYDLHVVDAPEVGRIKLTLTPPDYTRLPREVRHEGHIAALKGTAVEIEAQATKAVKEGKLLLEPESQLPLEIKGSRLTGKLLVFSDGRYSIRVKDELGFENPNPVNYAIRLIPDQSPAAEIRSPGRDLEVRGDEELAIVYTASDDFGLTAAKLIHRIGGKEISTSLKIAAGSRSVGPETFKWELAALSLLPGDKVAYRLGVWDNDTISGPKEGSSRTFTLAVRDERARITQEGEEAQRVAAALLNLLGDRLESIGTREDWARRMEEILKQVEQSLARMANRPERLDWEALRRNLSSLKEKMPRAPEETVTQEMERLALLAEELAQRASMNDVEAMSRELKNRQRRLLDMLSDLKGPLDKEAQEAALKELQKLEELLRSVMEALSKMASNLPDEFLNSSELGDLNFQDLFQDLAAIRENLLAGNLAEALEMAQRFLQTLSQMMASLGKASSRAQISSANKLQGEMSRQAGELDKIIAEQQEILKETEKVDKALKELAAAETARRLQELKKKADALFPDLQEIVKPEEREKFPGLSSREGKLQDRTAQLKEKLELLAQLFPGMESAILDDLEGAAKSMGKAAGQLRGEDAPGAIPPEEEAIRGLSKSSQALQQMAQQMTMRMQANRWGQPFGYDPRAGWYYGPWSPMPTLPQPELRRPPEKGYTGYDREEFQPPSKDAYKVPERFREKVLKSLKEEVPPAYRKEVDRYFRGLTE